MKCKHHILLAATLLTCVGGVQILRSSLQNQKQDTILKAIFEKHATVSANGMDVTDSFLCEHLFKYEQKQYSTIYQDIAVNDYEINSFFTADNTPLLTRDAEDNSCFYDNAGAPISTVQ